MFQPQHLTFDELSDRLRSYALKYFEAARVLIPLGASDENAGCRTEAPTAGDWRSGQVSAADRASPLEVLHLLGAAIGTFGFAAG